MGCFCTSKSISAYCIYTNKIYYFICNWNYIKKLFMYLCILCTLWYNGLYLAFKCWYHLNVMTFNNIFHGFSEKSNTFDVTLSYNLLYSYSYGNEKSWEKKIVLNLQVSYSFSYLVYCSSWKYSIKIRYDAISTRRLYIMMLKFVAHYCLLVSWWWWWWRWWYFLSFNFCFFIHSFFFASW